MNKLHHSHIRALLWGFQLCQQLLEAVVLGLQPRKGLDVGLFLRRVGGSDVGNALPIRSESLPFMGRPESVALTLPPLGALILRRLPDE